MTDPEKRAAVRKIHSARGGHDAIGENGLNYRELFHRAPAGVGLATPEGRVIACNPAMETLFGYTEAELKEISLKDLYQDHGCRKELLDTLDRHGVVSGFEVTLIRKDGIPFTACLTMTPVPVDGKTFFLTLLQDVSEQARARENLQGTYRVLETIFENAHMQIAYLDQDFFFIRVNGPYASYHGMHPDDLAGRHYFDFPRHHENMEVFRQVLETGEPHMAVAQAFGSHTTSNQKDMTYWDWSLVPILDGDGHSSGFILMLKDVSERVKAEQALIRSQEQLYQAQKMESLGVLVAGVAHEINNPINQIIFNIPLLKRVWEDVLPLMKAWTHDRPPQTYGGLSLDFMEDNLPQLLDNMDMAANRIARIVHDLKTFSRGSGAGEKQVLSLNTAVDNAIRLAQSTLLESGIQLTLDLEDDLPPMKGHLPHLEQIVLNLLINAVEAVGDHQGEVAIRTRSLNGDLVLSVFDNGKGIPPGIADTIFDPFVTDRHREGGTGLGLSVTRKLVHGHGAEITFDTREGEGTTFIVTFPSIQRDQGSI